MCQMVLKIIVYLSFILFSNSVFSEPIPVIVIAPGKTIQAKSTVGSDIAVIGNQEISQSDEYFIGDIINDSLPGIGMFQSGGHGTVTGIQMRGLPGRYSTVYIDGVKMTDPSTPDGRFYGLNNIPTSSIERIEVLKGTNSSLYGSNSISGSIHIHTKKAKEEDIKQDISLNGGSFGTRQLAYNFFGKKDKHDLAVNLNGFATDGTSAMNDNDEKDSYRSEGLSGNYGYQLNDVWRIENSLRYQDTLLEYDEPTYYNTYNDATSGKRADGNSTDDYEASYSFKLIQDKNKFKNQIIVNKYKTNRQVQNYKDQKNINGDYTGYRDSINYIGEYNYNLDTRIIYGLDNEFEASKFGTYSTGYKSVKRDEFILSQYADVQFRPKEKLYSTFGLRRDDHRVSGDYYSARATFAYNYDNNTKFRTSFGNGIKFPTTQDLYMGTAVIDGSSLKPEQSVGIDFGIDKYIENLDLDLSLTLFKVNYEDHIAGWASNVNERGSTYAVKNSAGKIKNQGVELSTSKLLQDDLKINFNYTYTDSFDGEDCDNPDKRPADCIDEQGVLVPRHSMNGKLTKNINNLDLMFKAKYVGERRSYGNFNSEILWGKYTTSHDMILGHYATFDILANLKGGNGKNYFFSLKNILDTDYETSHAYKGEDRTFNLGVKTEF